MSLLAVKDLHVWFDLPHGGRLHAVQGITFEVEAGERLARMGGLVPGAAIARLRAAEPQTAARLIPWVVTDASADQAPVSGDTNQWTAGCHGGLLQGAVFNILNKLPRELSEVSGY